MVSHVHARDIFLDPDLPLHLMRLHPQEPCGDTTHDFYLIAVVLGGQGIHVTEGHEFPVAAGDVYVVSDVRRHAYRETQDLHLINICYDPELLKRHGIDLGAAPGYHVLFALEPASRVRDGFESRLRLGRSDLARIEGMIESLESELISRGAGFRAMACATFMRLVVHLARCYEQSDAPPSQALLRIGKAISYLEEHYAEQFTVEELASIAHMSERHFQRVFREAMGDTPIGYLLRLRISRAAEMLRRGGMSVTEVAFSVGFQSPTYFSRQFRNIMGISPKAFSEVKHS